MNPKANDHGLFFDTETGELVCAHLDTYIEPACCSPFDIGDSGHVECGCHGRDVVICPNPACTGLTDQDVERIFENHELSI